MNEFQKQFIEQSSCMVCGNIAMQPKECFNCNRIICFLCEMKISHKNGQREPHRQCPGCMIVEEKFISEP